MTVKITTQSAEDISLDLPRILCLHGGGTNSTIFRTQCRAISRQLASEFRLVFAEAPHLSQAGPDVLSVYASFGPFKRWIRWKPEHPTIHPDEAVRAIDSSLEDAMREDDEQGATGEWVAILGFSQGAKIAASILYRQQLREQYYGRSYFRQTNTPYFRFGVIMAGRAPFVALDRNLPTNPPLPDASQITDTSNKANRMSQELAGHCLHIPTVHVLGLKDPGLEMHRQLYRDFCDDDTKRLVEWDGDHRLPIKTKDVSLVTSQIRELAEETGVY
jgi:hypothetical protein